MRLLVTRPEPEASETTRRLRGLGHEVLAQPLTRIEFAAAPESIEPPGALAFTSRNGVRAVERWPQMRAWRGLPVFVVGASTAAEARRAGFAHIRVGGGNSADLARLIMDHRPNAGPVLYPAAHDRSGDLAGTLASAGINVTLVEAYQAAAVDRFEAPVRDALKAGGIEGILFYSRRSASVFADLAAKEEMRVGLGRTGLLALSEQVAEPLRSLGSGVIRIAVRPEEAALLDLIPPAGKDGPAAIPPL